MITFILGTRPEAIKLVPIMMELRNRNIPFYAILTGQQKEAKEILKYYNFQFNDLGCESLQDITETIEVYVYLINQQLNYSNSSCIIVQGDTTSAYCGSLVGFLNRVPVVHVEAGLRTSSIQSPFPEEGYRRMITQISSYHFAPTEWDAINITGNNKQVVGNTVIDLLRETIKEVGKEHILLTIHRRENDNNFELFKAIRNVISYRPDEKFIFVTHIREEKQKFVKEQLSGLTNVEILPPQPYWTFINLLAKAKLVITDSGGIQEEAAYLQKLLIVLRDETERSGGYIVKDPRLLDATISLAEESAFPTNKYKFGRGNSSQLIVDKLVELGYHV